MIPHIVEKTAFTIVGVAAKTSFTKQAEDAALLSAKLNQPGLIASIARKTNPEALYALNMDYKPADQSYLMILGYEVEDTRAVSANLYVLAVPATKYSVFTAVGPQPSASIDAWQEIMALRGRPDFRATGPVSFEIHDARSRLPIPEVDIYIPGVFGGS
jgi:predicted transcriptional regulator YdeE